MTAKRSVTFGAVCAECPLRSRCTTAKDGRSMSIHPHEQLLRAARAQARTPEFKQAYPTVRWSSGSWPGPPPAAAGGSNCATSAWRRITPGCDAVAPQSICAHW
ncbi:transposase [Mycobacterium intracellulare]|uniref:transposase n=1 Tax=Mycobacterium intracellulare TaxID=1767 RepID=UPI003AABC8E7